MLTTDACTLLVQLLNPKLRYIGNDNSLLAMGALRYILVQEIYNIKLSRERDRPVF